MSIDIVALRLRICPIDPFPTLATPPVVTFLLIDHSLSLQPFLRLESSQAPAASPDYKFATRQSPAPEAALETATAASLPTPKAIVYPAVASRLPFRTIEPSHA